MTTENKCIWSFIAGYALSAVIMGLILIYGNWGLEDRVLEDTYEYQRGYGACFNTYLIE